MHSESSSPDEKCNCGHGRRQHPALTQGRCTGEVLTPQGDDRNNCPCKIFGPAYLSMAGPIDLRSAPAEPEAPEDDETGFTEAGFDQMMTEDTPVQIVTESPGTYGAACPPRRPPYAVAYAVEGGALYEIALPGDASVRAVDGALVITHPSAVLALTGVRPLEEPE